ncbi:hypothetical protein D3C77_369510 [compost metagenome]
MENRQQVGQPGLNCLGLAGGMFVAGAQVLRLLPPVLPRLIVVLNGRGKVGQWHAGSRGLGKYRAQLPRYIISASALALGSGRVNEALSHTAQPGFHIGVVLGDSGRGEFRHVEAA